MEATADEIATKLGLAPLPVEGGLYRRTWAGPVSQGRPAGSAILVLLTEGDGFSALHRLPVDEVWHRYLGDPVELLMLGADARVVELGPDVLDGQHVQLTVPAGTWMGARVRPGGKWALVGTTMAPGFVPTDYIGGDPDLLALSYPQYAELIHALSRPGDTAMPPEVDR
ncbi:cupin domain-containing protein [Actinokineospora soli]|uniref:Cupin domain-containing protein n=1 Tax=Actinokineospora soli TaxID=1048753 RepID=A0ABW2TJM3_9PSEU